ncbi:hypothetical protein ES708_28550 [subsurface metagenome]
MTSTVNILFTVFLLLPGFLAMKIGQSTKEYRELSAFEFTTISVGYSLLIVIIWIFTNWLLFVITSSRYGFVNDLYKLITKQNYAVLFSKFTIVFFLTYVCCFITFSVIVFNIHWIDLWKKLSRKSGFTRFSYHLTPWEDFHSLNRLNWIAVELKDGRTLIGKPGLISHLPFERELVLKRVKDSPIVVYDKNQKKVEFGPAIDQTYIDISEINAIHAIEDKNVEITKPNRKDYYVLFLSLLFFIVFFNAAFGFLVLRIEHIFELHFLLHFLCLFISILFLILNLRSLRTFS